MLGAIFWLIRSMIFKSKSTRSKAKRLIIIIWYFYAEKSGFSGCLGTNYVSSLVDTRSIKLSLMQKSIF